MKITVFLVALFIVGSLFVQGKEVSGVYETNFGELTIKHIGSKVTGTYTHSNGKIEGSIIGTKLTGWWYQDNGKGRFEFDFASDFSSFNGVYGYDSAEPSSTWNGKRIGEVVLIDTGSNGITGVYKTDFKDMILTRRGNSVSGNYKHMDGKISGTLEGNVLTGTWHQTNVEGKMIFVFASDFSSFTGKWGGNNETPTSPWNGQRIGVGSSSAGKSAASTSVVSSKKLFGTFNSDFNKLTFHQTGNKVSGNYEYQNGRIDGSLNGNILTGWWYQDNGKGKFRFVFNSDFSSFSGKWGYDDTNSGQWNGSK